MAKPERHPWPYGPKWNYYYPYPNFNFSKIPVPNGQRVNFDSNKNYLSIRCPEPHKSFVPYAPFSPFSHQEGHPVHTYLQPSSVFPSKHYMYQPLSRENINNPYKITENIQSSSPCSNYSLTKDQSSCYQKTWNNTSHFQRNPPELDVRHFLATWQDKDDDFFDVSSEIDQKKVYEGNDSIPLDCSKHSSNDKNFRKSHKDNFFNMQTLNPADYIVPPYYLKDDTMTSNSQLVSDEINNNVFSRNNLNYEESNQDYSKYFYQNSLKFPASKLFPCEHNSSFNRPFNHCDINCSQLNYVNQLRQKDILIDSSERSQYNLSSSLESGDLFCDINPGSEEISKLPVIHPSFNDSLQKMRTNVGQCDLDNEKKKFPKSFVTDFQSSKDSWDMFLPNLKYKEDMKVFSNSKCINKVSPQNHYDHLLTNNNNSSDMNIKNNSTSIADESAFNILSNFAVNSSNSVQLNGATCIVQSRNTIKPIDTLQSVVSTTKVPTSVAKAMQANTKIKPYQFNEEISSEDIDISIGSDISIASSGDFNLDDNHSNISYPSVINFFKLKKEKITHVLQKHIKKNENYSPPVLIDKPDLNRFSPEQLDNQETKLNGFSDIGNRCDKPENTFKGNEPDILVHKRESSVNVEDAIDLSVLKAQSSKEADLQNKKDPIGCLNVSNNDFEESNANEFNHVANNKNNCLGITSEKCEDSDLNETRKCITDNYVQDMFEDPTSYLGSNDKLLGNNNIFISNDNLLLLAHCSQEFGYPNKKEQGLLVCEDSIVNSNSGANLGNQSKSVRDSVIKCSLRWDRIFNIVPNVDEIQADMSLDLGPAKVELRVPADNCSSNDWKIVEADNKTQNSSIVQVKRLILKRKNQNEEKLPKMIIKKMEGQEYRSYLKKESTKDLLN